MGARAAVGDTHGLCVRCCSGPSGCLDPRPCHSGARGRGAAVLSGRCGRRAGGSAPGSAGSAHQPPSGASSFTSSGHRPPPRSWWGQRWRSRSGRPGERPLGFAASLGSEALDLWIINRPRAVSEVCCDTQERRARLDTLTDE